MSDAVVQWAMRHKNIMGKKQKKIGKVMHEWKAGKLHSGKGGPIVKNRKQAIAISMSVARKM
jgi:hypothetical protein